MNEIEKTCENCKYDIEDGEGKHCRNCIHNAVEMFEPKERELDIQAIRNKAIDDFVDAVKEKFPDDICGNINIEIIAQQLKDGDVE